MAPYRGLKRAAVIAVVSFLLFSCSEGMVRKDRFGSIPVRQIKIWAMLDGRSADEVRALMEEASTEMTREAGIALSTVFLFIASTHSRFMLLRS